MSLAQMQVFNEYVQPLLTETIAQMVEKFNAASGGALTLTTQGFSGDFLQKSYWKSLHGSAATVDRYAALTDPTPIDIEQIKESGVKVAARLGPHQFEPSQLTWLEKPTQEGIDIISRQMAEEVISFQLNTLIGCLKAAITNNADVTNDISADPTTPNITYGHLNSSLAKFGDHSSAIRTHVMTGAVKHRLIGQNLVNAEQLFTADSVQMLGVDGKIYVVTDAPDLVETGPNREIVLSLAQGAGIVYDGGDSITNIETKNRSRIVSTMQTDFAFGVGMKGYGYDEVNGTKSPDAATLRTGTNWDRTATSHKHTAGVATIGAV